MPLTKCAQPWFSGGMNSYLQHMREMRRKLAVFSKPYENENGMGNLLEFIKSAGNSFMVKRSERFVS